MNAVTEIPWWTWSIVAAAYGSMLVCILLKVREFGIHPLRKIALAFRRPWFETLLLLFCIGGFVQYGATKGTGGANSQSTALAMMNVPVLNPASSDYDGLFGLQNSIAATNLGFWGIEKGVDSVSFGIAWPESAFFTDNRLDLYGNWRLATNEWSHLAQINIAEARSNVIVSLPFTAFPTSAMEKAAFYLVAKRDDSDGDGLSDAFERLVSGTMVLQADSDGDGIDDGKERLFGTDPTSADCDGDGLSDAEEIGSVVMMPDEDALWQQFSGNATVWTDSTVSDNGSFVIDLPCPYTVNGIVYTQLRICADGVMYLLNPENPAWWYSTIFYDPPTLSEEQLSECHIAIAGFCADLYVWAAAWGSWAAYGTANTPSGPASVIDFYNIGFRSERTSSNPHLFSYQLILPSKEDNVFYLTYRPMSPSSWFAAQNPTVGVQCPMLSSLCAGEQYYNLVWKPTAESFSAMRRVKFTIGRGSNPTSSDSDGDGFSDCDEAVKYLTDPNSYDADTDADSLPDETEARLGTDLEFVDTDRDGLEDGSEFLHGLNPLQPDSDGDGMNDGWECKYDGGEVIVRSKGARSGSSTEVMIVNFNPLNDNDTDADFNNDSTADPDGDGITNAEECALSLNPCHYDSDGDGVDDSAEIEQGSDPGDSSDTGLASSRIGVSFYFGDHSESHSEKYRLSVVPVQGAGTKPSSFNYLNEEYGECETKTAFLKPGWKYEVRLEHAGTNKSGSPDYDYTLELSGNVPGNVIIDDGDSLFGVDTTSSNFAAAGKVATITVYAVSGVSICSPNNVAWTELEEDRVLLDDEVLRVKIEIAPPLSSLSQAAEMFGSAVTIKTSGSCPGGVTFPLTEDATQETLTDKSEIRIAKTRDELQALGLLPQNGEDGINEMAWLDTGSADAAASSNLSDSEAFSGLGYQFRGKATGDATKTLESTPPNSRLSESFFKAAGCEVIQAVYAGMESNKRQIMNQADYFYYSGHGRHSDGSLTGLSDGTRFTPALVSSYWGRDLNCVIFAGCSVLDINDYNGNYEDDSAHNCSPGKLWSAISGPESFLGYAYKAPSDIQNADEIIRAWITNRNIGDVEAWMLANDNRKGRNACAIDNKRNFHYFKKLFWLTYKHTIIPKDKQ